MARASQGESRELTRLPAGMYTRTPTECVVGEGMSWKEDEVLMGVRTSDLFVCVCVGGGGGTGQRVFVRVSNKGVNLTYGRLTSGPRWNFTLLTTVLVGKDRGLFAHPQQ